MTRPVPGLKEQTETPMPKAMLAFAALLCGAFATAQQTGSIEGVVTLRGATAAPDIVVVAKSDVMPRARTTRIDAEGRYAPATVDTGRLPCDVRNDKRGQPDVDHRRAAGPNDRLARRT